MVINKNNFDLIIGAILCTYIVLLNVFSGKISFSEIFFLVGLTLIVFHFVKSKIYSNTILNKAFKIIRVLILIGLIIFTIIEGLIISFPKRDSSLSNYTIILGAGIRGEELSTTLRQRLDKAVKYYNLSENKPYIVVSGGQGKGESITEAEAMRRYLVSNGIPQHQIIKEDKSTNTFENFKFSKDVIEKHSTKSVTNLKIKVITSDFHALRSNMIAERNGYSDITFYTNLTFPTLIPVSYSREAFALVKSFVFDK